MINKPTIVYRQYDAHEQLLYVGISKDLGNRLSKHMTDAEWFSRVEVIRLERYDTREEALEAERQIIQDEQPVFNNNHARAAFDNGDSKLMTPQACAAALQISTRRFHQMMKNGDVVFVEVGGQPRIPREWLDSYLTGLIEAATPPKETE